MAAARSQIPSYRKRSGYGQAIVTPTDSASGKLRDERRREVQVVTVHGFVTLEVGGRVFASKAAAKLR